jgi:hypothetical protein
MNARTAERQLVFRDLPLRLMMIGALLANVHPLRAASDNAPELAPIVSHHIKEDVKRLPPSITYSLAVNLKHLTTDLGYVAVPANHFESRPLKIGIGRQTEVTSAGGAMYRAADGTGVRIFAIRSPGAAGVRVRFAEFQLAPGDEVWVRSASEGNEHAMPFVDRGPRQTGEFWSHTVEGDTAVIEYHVRSGTERPLRVAAISHMFEKPSAAEPVAFSCHVDASCSSVGTKSAVARITFVDWWGDASVCTGTLLNNTTNDRTAYFLTANHCVADPVEAETVEAYWLYQTSSCNSGWLRNDWFRTTGGADVLATSESNDATLLRLVAATPSSVGLAGWSAAPQPVGTTVFGLHHPDGYVPPAMDSSLRRSEGSISGGSGSCLPGGYQITWNSGTTEPGSSGSGLFIHGATSTHLVGVLSCGEGALSCTENKWYGRLSNFYPEISRFLSPPPISIADGTDTPQLSWSAGGATPWRGHNAVTIDGVDAGATGRISHNQETWMQTTVAGPGRLSFRWKVSSESGYDYLRFRLNGAEVTAIPRISGNTGWLWRSIVVPAGAHTFRWTYSKDGSADRGSDAAWVDLVKFAGPKPNFNGDHASDLVWQNAATGQPAVWFMNGTVQVGERLLPPVPAEWQIAGTGDFNTDGHADIVWQNVRDGHRAIWLMNGSGHSGEWWLPRVADVNWRIATANDFNGDGYPDLVWQNLVTGHRTVWLMRGAAHIGEQWLYHQPISPEWLILGSADFNGDGEVDLLWQNTRTGQGAVWLMNGTIWIQEQLLMPVSPRWRIAGTGDFNGDASPDIVWQHLDTGDRAVWLMNGTTRIGERWLPRIPVEWSIRNN